MVERMKGMDSRQRLLLIIGVVVVLFAGIYFLFLRDTGGPEPFTAPTPGPRSTRAPRATPTPSPTGAPEVFDGFGGKDPFQPLVGDGGGGTPTAQPSPGPTGGPTGGQRVELLDIYTQSGTRYATVEVNQQQYTVKAGDTFAGSYRVLSLTASCGTFSFGDERFTLCVGQEVLK